MEPSNLVIVALGGAWSWRIWRLSIWHYTYNETFTPISLKDLFVLLNLYVF